jgi:hypothetical protein
MKWPYRAMRGFTPSRTCTGRRADTSGAALSGGKKWFLRSCPSGLGYGVDGGQDSALPATVSALANGIDRRQAAPGISTLDRCGRFHMNEQSLIRDFLLIHKGFFSTQRAGLSALRHGGGAASRPGHRFPDATALPFG